MMKRYKLRNEKMLILAIGSVMIIAVDRFVLKFSLLTAKAKLSSKKNKISTLIERAHLYLL
ncbi:hypothetical protein GCM10022397_39100 [Flavivirga jejuensis]